MTKQQNAVQKFINETNHTVSKEDAVWVCRGPKGGLSKHFPPAKTRVGLYQTMFDKLVSMKVITEVAK